MGEGLLNPLCLIWCLSISFHTLYPYIRTCQHGISASQFLPSLPNSHHNCSILAGATQYGLVLLSCIQHTLPPPCFQMLLYQGSTPQSALVLLYLDWHFFVSFCTPDPPVGTSLLVYTLFNPLSHSASLMWSTLFSFCASQTPSIHSSFHPSTFHLLPIFSKWHSPSGASLFLVDSPIFHSNISCCQ